MVKRENWKVLILPLVFLCSISALGQTSGVEVEALLAPVNTLSINDLDFVNTTTPKWLFTVSLTPRVPVPLDVRMNIRLAVSLANDGTFDRAAEYQTRPFTLTGPRSITNFDLRDPAFKESFHIDDQARRQFENTALPGGVVPSGAYEFIVEITSADGQTVLGNDEERLTLTNPGVVELLFPSDGEGISTQYPLFQWRGDAPEWRLSVYQQLPGQSSLEEAASGIPHLTTTVSSTNYQYPSGGARYLEKGNTYVWFVEGMLQGTGGATSSFRSPLRSFFVTEGPAALAPSLLDELARALGPRYQGMINQLRSQGLSPSGTVRLNGSPISTMEMMNILGVLRTNPDAVTTVVIE